jgi:hypothetical protein
MSQFFLQFARWSRTNGQILRLVIALLACTAGTSALAQTPIRKATETPTATAKAPPGQAIVGAQLGGSFFAPKPLKARYDELLGKMKTLEREIAEGRISGNQAKVEVATLKTELSTVRQEIDRQKTFVPVAELHTKSDETSFELGPERRLLIFADKVRIVGWDRQEVKCVLEKTVLTAGDEPVAEHFEGIQLVHEHRSAEKEVGKTADEMEAQDARFLESEEGKKLDAKGREWRRSFLDQNKAYGRIYRPLQGRTIDVVSVKGFSHAEGNRQITLDVRSDQGEGSMSSHWQRHATLTVFVPACEVVAVQGGLGGLDIQSVEAAVIVRGDGDRDYHGKFRAQGVKGSLTVDRLPLQSIGDVSGDVEVTMMAYLGNSGTRHADGVRTSYVFPPENYVYSNIAGDFRGRFVRADLNLIGVGGNLDVVNEYGKTVLNIDKPLPEAAHRIISLGGHIEVNAGIHAFADVEVLAASECGTVRVGSDDRDFKDFDWTIAMPDGASRGWHGFERRPQDAADSDSRPQFPRFERVAQALNGDQRGAGLDVISRGGSIQILKAN